tara:strand:+ start:257 stop:376 length:120 start_codon:yes stop_codon:yes gene_type:complete
MSAASQVYIKRLASPKQATSKQAPPKQAALNPAVLIFPY